MNEQPPWGQKKRTPEPEDFFTELIKKLRALMGASPPPTESNEARSPQPQEHPFKGGGRFFSLVMAAICVQLLFSAFYTINPGEVGVVLRFGKYLRTTSPGLHMKIPYLEKLIKVNVEAVRKEEFGFRTRTPSGASTFDRKGFDMESLMLTGDKNVIEMAWIVQYKVSDPVHFLFKVRDVSQAVRDASEMVLRRIVGNMDFDYVLGNRDILAASAKKELQGELDNLECGVNVFTLQLQDINPPEQVKPAFNEVNEADQDMKRLVNEAEKTYNEVIPKARGGAKQIVENAHGYAIERVNRAKGETTRFGALVQAYKGAELVTRQRMYLEAMEELLPQVERVYIMEGNAHAALPLLDLNQATKPREPSPGASVTP